MKQYMLHAHLFFTAVLFFYSGILSSAPQRKWLGSLEQGFVLARQKNQPILLDLYAPWCGFCRTLQKKVYPSPSVRFHTGKFIRVRINGEKKPELMRRYQASGFPTAVFLDSNGALLGRIDGFVRASALVQKLKKARKNFYNYENMLAKIKEEPHSLHWNYEGGRYYFKIQSYSLAHKHFLAAWASSLKSLKLEKENTKNILKKRQNKEKRQNIEKEESIEKRKKALYNAAVSSMHLDNYSAAVREWNLYLKHYPKKNRGYIYARYYRGLSFFYQGKKEAARLDLGYAGKNLRDGEERDTARSLLNTIP